MFTRKLRAAVLMAGAVLAGAVGVLAPASASAATATRTATTAAAAPADTAVRSGWFGLQTYDGSWCLDSNAAGNVYVNPCQVPGNKYQDWSWTEWEVSSPYGDYDLYSIQDEATGRCLDSNAAGQVYTNPCQAPGNGYQDWYWEKTAVPNIDEFTNVNTSRPLWGFPGDAVSTSAGYSDWNYWVTFQ